MRKHDYTQPEISVIALNLEQAILEGSSENLLNLPDEGDIYNPDDDGLI